MAWSAMNNGTKLLADLVAASKRAPPPQSVEARKPLASSDFCAPSVGGDLTMSILNRLAFGIPVEKWLDILCAARTMVANAEKECGGDGNGCHSRQGVTTRCAHCPMTQIDELRELMK